MQVFDDLFGGLREKMYFCSVIAKETMDIMCRMTKNDKEKLGNTAVYIASHTKNLSKTKLLKLLYFMEEYSVRRFHTPFLGLPYEVWQAGPVVKDVFIDLSENLVILDGYVTKEVVGDATYILPAKSFSDDEFSDNDLFVMDEVIRKYGDKTAKELVGITHRKGSLWHKVAERNNRNDISRYRGPPGSTFRLSSQR